MAKGADAAGCVVLVAEDELVATHAGRAEIQAAARRGRRQIAIGQVQNIAGIEEIDAAEVGELGAGLENKLVVHGHHGAAGTANLEQAPAKAPRVRVLNGDSVVGRPAADEQAEGVHFGVGDGEAVTAGAAGANGNHAVRERRTGEIEFVAVRIPGVADGDCAAQHIPDNAIEHTHDIAGRVCATNGQAAAPEIGVGDGHGVERGAVGAHRDRAIGNRAHQPEAANVVSVVARAGAGTDDD